MESTPLTTPSALPIKNGTQRKKSVFIIGGCILVTIIIGGGVWISIKYEWCGKCDTTVKNPVLTENHEEKPQEGGPQTPHPLEKENPGGQSKEGGPQTPHPLEKENHAEKPQESGTSQNKLKQLSTKPTEEETQQFKEILSLLQSCDGKKLLPETISTLQQKMTILKETVHKYTQLPSFMVGTRAYKFVPLREYIEDQLQKHTNKVYSLPECWKPKPTDSTKNNNI